MGGGKETPRQKMIGLMYLVLMALLAINVSKEVINAFVTLNNKMERQNESVERSNYSVKTGLNNSIMQAASEAGLEGSFDEIMAQAEKEGIEKIIKLGFLLKQYESTHALSQRSVNAVMDMANELLKAGDPSQDWIAEGELGYKKIIELNDHEKPYGKKDDYDTPTRMFVDEGKGDELLKAMYNYRDSLVLTIALGGPEKDSSKLFGFTLPEVKKATNEDTAFVETVKAAFPEYKGTTTESKKLYDQRTKQIVKLYEILTFPEKVDNHGEQVPWVQGAFDHSPMVAAAALFTSLKGQMLQAESVVLGFLANQNDVPPFTFDTIEPKSFASTSYINSGDSLTLEVMVAAYDSKKLPQIRYWVDDTTNSPDNMQESDVSKITLGKGLGGGVGQHIVTGQISVEENGKKEWKPFTPFSYKIGSPASAIGNAEMNVMYIGYDNIISASGSGYSNVQANCSGCSSWSKSGEAEYKARVSRPGTVTVSLSGENKEGKRVPMDSKEFRVLPMPKPTVFFAGQDPTKNSLPKTVVASGILTAQLVGSPLSIRAGVTGGTITVTMNGISRDFNLQGNRIPPQAAALIRQMPSGAMVVISPKTQLNGQPVRVSPVGYKVM